MNHFRFSLCLLAFSLLLTSAPTSAQAQGQLVFTTPDWLATISGDVSDGVGSLTVVDDLTTCLELDPTLGEFEGFLLQTNTFFPPTISLFDGDTLVETVALNAGDSPFNLNLNAFSYGWINTDGLSVTKILIEDNSFGNLNFIGFNLSTIPAIVEPPILPAEVIIPMLVDDIEELMKSDAIGRGEGGPIKSFLKQALKNINKGKIDKAIDKLIDANERVLELIENGSLSGEEVQTISDLIDSAIVDLLDEEDDVFDCSEC